jgi:biotin carboxyl carrier protein
MGSGIRVIDGCHGVQPIHHEDGPARLVDPWRAGWVVQYRRHPKRGSALLTAVAVAYATIEQSAAPTTTATAATEDVMKLPLNAEPRPVGVGAGIAARLAAAVENFKSAMLAVDRLIADSSTTDAEIQNHVGEACAVVTDQLRKHIEVNRPLENRVGAFVVHQTYRPIFRVFSAQRGRLRAPSRFAACDIGEGDDVKAAVEGMSRLGPREVTATYPGVLAEWLVIDGGRVAPGQPLVRLDPVAGAR